MRKTLLAPFAPTASFARVATAGLLGAASFVLAAACSDDPAPAQPAATGGTAGAAGGAGAAGAGAGAGGAAAGAAGAAADEPYLDGDCDPLVPTQCGYPFPSNVWTKKDETTKTGLRMSFGAKTLPVWGQTDDKPGKHIDPSWFDRLDGFSSGIGILTHLPGATATGLPTQDTIPTSVDAASSPTILLDVDTGKLIEHWSEIDMSSKTAETLERSLIIRPAVRIPDGHRVIVAIRNVKDEAGTAIAPTPVFVALRDGTESPEKSVARRRALYTDIFARLATAGIEKGSLQAAWDYTVASTDSNTRDMVHMRDQALALVGADGPEYTIDKVDEAPNDHIRKRLHLKMKVPSYMSNCLPGAQMNRGADGLPAQNGFCEYPVLVHVPKNGATSANRAGLVQNGHGLLGSRGEGENGYLARFANEKNYVAFSVDLVGFAEDDFPEVAGVSSQDIGAFRTIVDRQHQGLLNSLLAMRMMKGRFVNEPTLLDGGQPIVDPSIAVYRGDSQGGIMGTTYMALSTDVTRGLLGEPGMPYNLLLSRSVDFATYFVILNGTYGKNRPTTLAIALIQSLWDHTEPNGYAPFITGTTLPNTPSHNVLLHVAIGDHQVTPLGAHLIARTVGAKNLTPANRSIWGLEETAGPENGNVMVEYDFGLPEAPKTNIPMSEGKDPHDEVRGTKTAFDQSDEFFRTGSVRAVCEGPCNPELPRTLRSSGPRSPRDRGRFFS